MGGEEEGAPHPSPAPGDPRPHDVCRQVSRRGGGLAVLNLPGAFAWHIRDVPETRLLASGSPRTILESNCLLIPSGCN